MLSLAPEVEDRVREYAAREGVTAEELIARAFPPHSPKPSPKALELIAAIQQWQTEDATGNEDELTRRDDERAELEANLDQPRQKMGMRLLFPPQEQN